MAVNIKKEFGNTRNRKPDISTLVYGKVPPQSPELEEAVLGALLLERDKLEEVITIIQHPEVLYGPANQKIYAAILRLYRKGAPVDLLTVTEELRKSSELELIGGPYYLTNLTMNVVNSAHTENHSRIIAEKYILREIIRISGELISQAYDDGNDAFMLLDNAENQYMELLQQNITGEPERVDELARENIMDAGERREKQIIYNGPRIGISKLEEYLTCWQPTDLVIIGARPATGKTALALQLGLNAATADEPAGVLFFSLEMGKKQLVNRLQANVSDTLMQDIKNPVSISDLFFEKYTKSEKKLNGLPFWIDDTGGLTVVALRAKVKKYVRRHGVKLVIIDYLQLMRGDGFNRENIVAEITRSLKEIAKELEITIIALSQLNRESAKGNNNVPVLADLRESGAIEQDADQVLLLSRPSKDDIKKEPALASITRVDIAKDRNGKPEDNISLHFDGAHQRFSDNNPNIPDTSPDGFRPMKPEEKTGTSYQGIDFKKKQSGEKDEDETPF